MVKNKRVSTFCGTWVLTRLQNYLVKSMDACVPLYGGRAEK